MPFVELPLKKLNHQHEAARLIINPATGLMLYASSKGSPTCALQSLFGDAANCHILDLTIDEAASRLNLVEKF